MREQEIGGGILDQARRETAQREGYNGAARVHASGDQIGHY